MLKKWSCVSALVACLTVQTLNARNIFVTSPDGGSATLTLFNSDPLALAGTAPGPFGATSVIAGPAGKYYAIGGSAAEGVVVLQGTFPSLTVAKQIPLPGAPGQAILSPDGRRLVVTIPGSVQIIDTANDTILAAPAGTNLGLNTPTVAISVDSRRLLIGDRSQNRVLVLTLENGTQAGVIPLDFAPRSLSVGPNSLLYVAFVNAFYEYDPNSLEKRGEFSLNGQPSPLQFTPDGRVAIAANESAATGSAAFVLDLVRRTVTSVPIPASGITFSKIVVGDNAAAYALSSQNNRIYYVNLLASGSVPNPYNVSNGSLENARDIALSNESPQARSLFVLTDVAGSGSLYKADITQNVLIGLPIQAPAGRLSFAPPPLTGVAAATLLPLNSSQTLAPNSSSLPIRARVVDAQGLPISGAPVTFATTAEGVTLATPSSATDQLGYVQTVVTIPQGYPAGVVTVTATSGGQSTSFSLTVTGAVDPGGPGPGPEPTLGGLQIVSGQGAVTAVGYSTNNPMTVRFVDASGNPVAGVPLTWTVTSGGGALGNASTETDANGIGTAFYSAFAIQFNEGYAPSTIAVSAGTQTVNFIVTTIPNLLNGQRGNAQYVMQKPVDRSIVARAGETITGAIAVNVSSWVGGGIPNVGMRLEPLNAGGATASCKGGTAMSDATGTVTCDLIAGAVLGDNSLRVIVGEDAIYTLSLRVEPGAANALSIVAGNNQSGPIGQALTTNLRVRVNDAGGNPLTNIPVTWAVVAAGSATLSATSTATDEKGEASVRVTLGQQPGLVQVRAATGAATVTFSLTAQAAGTQLQLTGPTQPAAPGQVFASPVTATVWNAQNQPVAGATVQFAVVSGPGTVSAASAITNANGVATVNVTAGANPGSIVVRATYLTLTRDVTLTVGTGNQGPQFSASSIVNAAGFQPGISPGSIAVITGTGIARGITGSVVPPSPGPLPTTLANVQVLFNGVAAPIFAVSNINGQESVNVQVPFEVTPGAATVTIRVTNGGETSVSNVPVQAVKPGLFEFVDANGRRYAVALRPDGSYVSSTNPARRGETVRVFATGMGQTNPATGTNRIGQGNQNVSALVVAGINGRGARLVSAKLQEGTVGVYIVEIEIDPSETAGVSQPVGFGIAGPDGQLVHAAAAIPIQ